MDREGCRRRRANASRGVQVSARCDVAPGAFRRTPLTSTVAAHGETGSASFRNTSRANGTVVIAPTSRSVSPTRRDRRIPPAEEQRLLAAAAKLNCGEHANAGAPMRDRIIGALETGCRLGEMLVVYRRTKTWASFILVRTCRRAPKRPSSLYRLSANCQPKVGNLVAGGGFEPPTFGL
jgi:hypothetical protein